MATSLPPFATRELLKEIIRKRIKLFFPNLESKPNKAFFLLYYSTDLHPRGKGNRSLSFSFWGSEEEESLLFRNTDPTMKVGAFFPFSEMLR